MNSTEVFDPEKSRLLMAEGAKWMAEQAEKKANDFDAVRQRLIESFRTAPDSVDVPFEKTAAGERSANFLKVCDEKFRAAIDPLLVKDPRAFALVSQWDGKSPAPIATGPTGLGKTFACWVALRNLYVRSNRAFVWFPVKRLVTELERYEKKDAAEDFYRMTDMLPIVFVDDLDKINWDFESQAQLLFSFFDWVYRTKKPCLVTTNRDRAWWRNKAGDAFVRRLFDEACSEVVFK